ncbi:MAG: type II toxin-antitoxin system RelE/ParE family toxin [Bacteriovoracaceae bacterium]
MKCFKGLDKTNPIFNLSNLQAHFTELYFLKYNVKVADKGVVSVEAKKEKKIHAIFYKTESGNEPVRDELVELGRPTKTMIGEDIKFIEYNWKLDRPYVDQLKKGNGSTEKTIYEVRSKVEDGNIKKEYRTLFFVYENLMILVHLFLKKSTKTPQKEIDVAWDRMKKWLKEERS